MKPGKRPTIRDVAAAAGVSKSLVSMVFSSAEGVSEERRQRVLYAAAQLGFTPNPWARSLAAGTTNFIGLIVTDLYNPLFIEMAEVARKALFDKGLQTLMTAASTKLVAGQRVLEKSSVQSLLDLRPSGLILIGDVSADEILKTVPKSVPIIFTTSIPSNQGRAIVLRGSEDEAMSKIVEHLAELGHKTIAYLGLEEGQVEEKRIAGFRKAVERYKVKALYEPADRTESEGFAAAAKILSKKNAPTALVCFNDMVAIGAQEVVLAHEAATGERIAVVGYDNTLLSGLNRVSITSIEQGKDAIALEVAELLTDAKRLEKALGKTIEVHPTLVVRSSTTSVDLRKSKAPETRKK